MRSHERLRQLASALKSCCFPCCLQDVGTRIEYDHEGRIKSTTSAPRAVGTTVVLKDLFKSLPVRHKVCAYCKGNAAPVACTSHRALTPSLLARTFCGT